VERKSSKRTSKMLPWIAFSPVVVQEPMYWSIEDGDDDQRDVLGGCLSSTPKVNPQAPAALPEPQIGHRLQPSPNFGKGQLRSVHRGLLLPRS
jgi:hypothetical protein